MEVGLFSDLGAQGIDDNEFAALPQTHADLAHEMQVGDRRVVAPHYRELGVLGRLGAYARDQAVSASPSLATHPSAHGPAIELARAELVKESQRHAIAGEHAVRAGVIQRHHRFWPVLVYDVTDPCVD